jgi:hypothetical protein
MNGWKDFKTDDKTSVMNPGEGEHLAWQLRAVSVATASS